MNKQMINLDANASHSPLPEVLQAVRGWDGSSLNPSSVHAYGQRSRAIVEQARDSLAALLGLKRHETIVFTSGATEANNAALWQVVLRDGPGLAMATTAIEHPSVLETANQLAHFGVETTVISPQALETDQWQECLSDQTALFSVMLANNETGQILPVPGIVRKARSRSPNSLVHCDAVQAIGKVEVSFEDLDADFMTVSGHKIGALPGIGALITREERLLKPFLRGGAQESGFRAGTENVLGILSLGIAAQVMDASLDDRRLKMEAYRQCLWEGLHKAVDGIELNWDGPSRLPNTLNVHIPGVIADDLVIALDLDGVAVSSGPACSAGKPEPSHVLLALGVAPERVRESVRISLEASYPEGAIEKAAACIVSCIHRLRVVNRGKRT